MSHSTVEIVYADRVVGYAEYDDTSDTLSPVIQSSTNEVDKNWRSKGVWSEAFAQEILRGRCRHELEQAWVVHSPYDLHFPVEICLYCSRIYGPFTLLQVRQETDDEYPKSEKLLPYLRYAFHRPVNYPITSLFVTRIQGKYPNMGRESD